MTAGELLLRFQHLEDRLHERRTRLERVRLLLASDAEVDAASTELATAAAAEREVLLRLRGVEGEVESHRARLRARNADLMSGRIRVPSELTKMSAEVDHMRARLREEEDAELEVMAEAETRAAERQAAEARLAGATARAEAARPDLEAEAAQLESEIAGLEPERDSVWELVPAEHQAAYRRVRVRPGVTEVAGGQCAACHVGVGTGQAQKLRRAELTVCDNCGRVLVQA